MSINKQADQRQLRVAQFNAARRKRAILTLLNEKDHRGFLKYDIALISEPPLNTNKENLFIPSDEIKAYYVSENINYPYHIYSAIYILNNHLKWQPNEQTSTAFYTEIEIFLTGRKVVLASIYCPIQTPLTDSLKQSLTDILSSNKNKIIGGDFNARHNDWEGRNLSNETGCFLAQEFAALGWVVCNTKGTFTRKLGRNQTLPTTIDLTIATLESLPLIGNWEVTENSYGSDHWCIQFDINAKVPKPNRPRIHSPSKKITREIIHNIKNGNYPSLSYELIILLRQRAVEKLNRNPPKLIPFTSFADNKEINLLRSNINKINRSLKQTSILTPHSQQQISSQSHIDSELSLLQFKLKRERCRLIKLKEKKIDQLKNKSLARKLKERGEALIWSEINVDIKDSNGINIIRDEEGRIITNHRELIIAIMKRLANKQTKSSRSLTTPTKHFKDYPLQSAEINRAIDSLMSSKAKGTDNIGASLIKELRLKSEPELHAIIREWWDSAKIPKSLKQTRLSLIVKSKEAINHLNDFRPIGVPNHFLIVLERIINERLYYFVNKRLLVKEQLGYRKGLSLSESMRPFVNYLVNSLDSNLRVIIWKMDIESAFEKIDSNIILNTLSGNIPTCLWNLIKDLLTDREVSFKSSELGLSITYPKVSGTTQGSSLSPTLFAAVMGLLHKKFSTKLSNSNFSNYNSIGPYSFADDFFGAFAFQMVTPSRTCQVQADTFLAFIEDSFNSILGPWGLNLAKNKLECCSIPAFKPQGKPIELGIMNNFTLKPKIKILGLTFGKAKHSLFGYHIEEKCAEINKLINEYKKNTWRYSFKLRRIITDKILIPKLFYLGELWAPHINSTQINQVNSSLRLMSIYAIGGNFTLSFVAASVLASIPPAFIWIQELSLLNGLHSSGILVNDQILTVQQKFNISDHFHPAFIPQPNKIITHFTHEEALEVDGPNDIHIYTDASLNDSHGGIAVVALKTKKSIQLKTHHLTSSHELELKAIYIALLMAEELFNNDKRSLHNITILTDSLSSLTQIQNLSSNNETILQIRNCLLYHSKWERNIQLIWIKGHNDSYGNDLADRLAKEAALSGFSYDIKISNKALRRHLAADSRQKWIDWYKAELSSTTRLKEFFDHKTFPPDLKLNPNFDLTALLTSHSPYFNDYKQRILKKSNGSCPCDGIAKQTGQHAVTKCKLLRPSRLRIYAALNIKEDLYENKQLENIEKDEKFYQFVSKLACEIRKYWK